MNELYSLRWAEPCQEHSEDFRKGPARPWAWQENKPYWYRPSPPSKGLTECLSSPTDCEHRKKGLHLIISYTYSSWLLAGRFVNICWLNKGVLLRKCLTIWKCRQPTLGLSSLYFLHILPSWSLGQGTHLALAHLRKPSCPALWR